MYHHQLYSSHQHHLCLPITPLRTSLYQTHPEIDLDSRFGDLDDPLSRYSDGLNQLGNDSWLSTHGTLLSNTGQRKPTGLLGIFDDSPRNDGHFGSHTFKDDQRNYDLGKLENTLNTYNSTRLFTPRNASLPFLYTNPTISSQQSNPEHADHSVSAEVNMPYKPYRGTEPTACSSCGAIQPIGWLCFLKPCLHPICMICINSLVNMSCNDPRPLSTNCFICGGLVESFKIPFGMAILRPSQTGEIPRDPIQALDSPGHPDHSKTSKALRYPLDCYAQDSPSIFDRSTDGDSLDDHSWSTSSFDYQKSAFDQPPTPSYTSSPDTMSPILCDKWPVVRVDNISWGQTVEGISNWLPTQDCLPPSELCPLPIHILCTAVDGKTLNYCFIETRNLASAHLLVRHRHATKLNMRPCSVGLTSLKELHDNIAPDYPRGIMATAEELLRLCVASSVKDLKAPERPFLHLVSIILHYPVLPGDQLASVAQGSNRSGEENTSCERLRMIYILAMQSLISARDWVPRQSQILRTMIKAGILSPLIPDIQIWSFIAQFGLVGLLDEVPNLDQWNNGTFRASKDNRFGYIANHPQGEPRIRRQSLGLENHNLLPLAQNENQIEALLQEITRSRIPNMKNGENTYGIL